MYKSLFCGGLFEACEEFRGWPRLELWRRELPFKHRTVDTLELTDIAQPAVFGFDVFQRPFLAFRVRNNETQETTLEILSQKPYSNTDWMALGNNSIFHYFDSNMPDYLFLDRIKRLVRRERVGHLVKTDSAVCEYETEGVHAPWVHTTLTRLVPSVISSIVLLYFGTSVFELV